MQSLYIHLDLGLDARSLNKRKVTMFVEEIVWNTHDWFVCLFVVSVREMVRL